MEIDRLITLWHAAVNARDTVTLMEIVAEHVVLGGPKGESEGLRTVIEWIDRAGITLTDVSWHTVEQNVMVVEEAATWPESKQSTSVFTRYQSDGRVLVSIHRYSDLDSALKGQ